MITRPIYLIQSYNSLQQPQTSSSHIPSFHIKSSTAAAIPPSKSLQTRFPQSQISCLIPASKSHLFQVIYKYLTVLIADRSKTSRHLHKKLIHDCEKHIN